MKNTDWEDVRKRAGKTFVEAFLAATIINVEQLMEITDVRSAKAIIAPILIAGLSAGLSAVWNMITTYISETED